MRLFLIGLALLSLPGCVATATVGLAGDVIEGAAKTTVFTAKTASKAAGAVLPGGGGEDEEDEAPDGRD